MIVCRRLKASLNWAEVALCFWISARNWAVRASTIFWRCRFRRVISDVNQPTAQNSKNRVETFQTRTTRFDRPGANFEWLMRIAAGIAETRMAGRVPPPQPTKATPSR